MISSPGKILEMDTQRTFDGIKLCEQYSGDGYQMTTGIGHHASSPYIKQVDEAPAGSISRRSLS